MSIHLGQVFLLSRENIFLIISKEEKAMTSRLSKISTLTISVAGDLKPPVSVNYLYILMVIAIAVLFIACANFVNLSTSQSEKRARETGLRKLAGGGRFQITCLFIGEAVTLVINCSCLCRISVETVFAMV